ncbi:PREDICTED: uncharacterized protein LOC108366676 [Rhagoletis zephyria]|uniref:uncharacterized protein LOC108366676 n=1 Tax=Rhagoletis zephyria TaxID=28612 RepID=UPI000811413E|nr:PREDICTED: uncharacterized protein LOC108366676 [Rhagoletis zephyria]
MTDKSQEKGKAKHTPPTSSANDVTPYYSVLSFDSPLQTSARTSRYQSALSATPQSSPVLHPNQRKASTKARNLAPVGTVTEGALRDTSDQTTSSIRPFNIEQPKTDEYATQTSNEVQLTAEIAAQTTSRINEFAANTSTIIIDTREGRDTATELNRENNVEVATDQRVLTEAGVQATQSTVELGVQTEAPMGESSIAETSFDSATTSVDEVHLYGKELVPEMVRRVKKYTKQRVINEPQLKDESSYTFSKRRSKPAQASGSTIASASLESLSYEDIHSANIEQVTEMSSPLTHNEDRNELEAQESDVPVEKLPVPTKGWQSSTSLSSEPNSPAEFPTFLELGNGFLYMIIPPDGGYGWLIVLISFLCQVIVDGIIYSIGILLPCIADDLGETQTTVVLVAAVQVGPVASAFINKYGFRPVAFGGAICSMVFILIGTYSHNMIMLIVFYGALGGSSLSLIWISSQLIIGYYFERYRPIANGFSCSGAGAGILIFSSMNAELCPKIGWRNTSRIHAVLLLCVLLMAITFIEVTPTRIAAVKKEVDTSSSSEDSSVPFSEVRYSQYHVSHFLIPASEHRSLEQMFEVYQPKSVSTIDKLCPCCRRVTKQIERVDEKDVVGVEYDNENLQGLQNYVLRVDPIEREDLFYTGTAEYDENDVPATSRRTTGHLILIDKERAATVHYSLSIMRAQRQHKTVRRTLTELRHRHKYPYLAYISPRNWMPSKLFNAFAKLFDTSLLNIMEFRLLLLSAFIFSMGFNIPFVYSKIRAAIDPFNSSLISTTIGLSIFVFCIASGFIANRYRSQTIYVCGGGIVFAGLAVLVSAFYGEDVVWFQYTYAICYGVARAFFSTLRAIIYVRTLGLDKLTNAFGLTGLAMGFGVFLGTTIAAVLNGWTKHYNAAFAFSGICLIIAGVLKIILPTLIHYRIKRLMDMSEANANVKANKNNK